MSEQAVVFPVGAIQLEGLLYPAPGERGVVITHPHPLYGGDMHNLVVETLARTYQRHGYATLRFNFRGVGASQGRYDDGEGEQQDVKAALDYLSAQGKTALDLVGYSFGAWVNALAQTAQEQARRLIMASPPVELLDFQPAPPLPKLALVITGGNDSFAPPAAIAALLPRWNKTARLEIIRGADHFYGAHSRALAERASAFLAGASAQ